MSQPAKRDQPERRPAKVETRAVQGPMPAMQIVLRRLWQGCYGASGGIFVALVGALFGERPPSRPWITALLVVIAVLAFSGVVIEVSERRHFPGGRDDG